MLWRSEMKKINKVLILGIDCLDYNLVLKWKLKNYRLRRFGYYFVGYDLYTPIIWAKFLTGEDVTKYGFSMKRLSRIKRFKSLYYAQYPLQILLNLIGRIRKRKTSENVVYSEKLLERVRGICDFKSIIMHISTMIHRNAYLSFRNLKLRQRICLSLLLKAAEVEKLPAPLFKKTFVYHAIQRGLKVLIVQFPPINDTFYALLRNLLYFGLDTSFYQKKLFVDSLWKVTNRSLNFVLKNLDKYDIILWYTSYIDITSHLFYRLGDYKSLLQLFVAYRKLNSKIGKVLSILNEDTAVLLISDHGYDPKRHDHSFFGFWSSNFPIPRNPRVIYDFAPIIKKLINSI